MKKRIIIFSHAMELGGAERALLGLLEKMDYNKYQIDLFLMRHEGELFSYLPKEVNLLPEIPQYACLAVPISKVVKRKQYFVLIGRIIGKILAKKRIGKLKISEDNGVELEYSHKYTLLFMPKISQENYDLAISFLTPHYFVSNKVDAKKKIAWIHTDYEKVKVDVDSELNMWSQYDYIASISDSVSENFLKVFPVLADKTICIKNMLPTICIKKQSEEINLKNELLSDECIKLLSVGRFCTAKNFDNVPDICKKIRDTGINVKWYLIGYGNDEELIRKKIAEYKMEEYVIILGKKANPYPYIKACDLYVQPSRYEGNSVSVHEAQLLQKPVVITQYATSGCQLEDGVDGIIVPMDNEGCAKGIVELLNNRFNIKRLQENCSCRDYSNSSEIDKIYKILEE